jgi:hypothetical protein
MLVTAEHVEVGRAPFAAATERSGLRSSHAITMSSGRYAATTGVREERVRTDSVGQMPAVTEATAPPEERTRQGSRPHSESVDESATKSRAGAMTPSSPEPVAPHEAVRSSGAAGRAPAARTVSSTATPAARTVGPHVPDATTSVQPPRAMPRRDPKRKLSSALQRLERNLKDLRQSTPTATGTAAGTATSAGGATTTSVTASGPTTVSAAPVPPRRMSGAATAPLDAAASRAHVEQLLRMRYGKRGDSAAQQPAAKQAEQGKSAADLFRQAQDLMRDNQWPRAHEAMRKVCEIESSNEQYLMYQRWAALRANVLDEDGMSKFRLSLRDKLSDDVLGKFAYYALGHLALVEKKDDAAEKLFRKALELDKHNKDAERHLRIIELRRKSAQTQANNKIFGIELGKKKS